MGVTILVHLLLVLPVVTLCSPDQWLHQIHVDNKTGIDDPSCWKEGYSTPCISLNLALTGAQHYNHSTIIFLQPGQHQLHSGSETQLRNMSQLAIVGNGSQGEVVIRCEPLAGLAFFWSEDIELRNVGFVSCGAQQNSTTASEYVQYSVNLQIQVSIFFKSCKTVQLAYVQVNESNGTGVVVYDPVGVVSMDRCCLFNNVLSDEQEAIYGGGGLVIEVTSQTVFTITNSTFCDNIGPYLSAFSVHPSEYFGLGRGGGISVVFRGRAANNTVQLSSVYLDSNRAQFGGGLYLAFLGNTSSNTVSVDGAEVTGNEALLETGSLLTPTSSGGGVFIGFTARGAGFPFDNSITVSSSKFTSNTAETGGGMTVDVLSNSNGCTTAGNKLVIEKCVFDNNEAFQGASAYMSQSSKSSQTLLDTTVCCSNFTNGHLPIGDISTVMNLPFYGNLLLKSFPITFKDYMLFAGNNLSAISLHLSSIELLPSAQLQFINNSAFNGAGLHIVDCSSVIVNNGTVMFFKNNLATYRGGAIYAESCTLGQPGGKDCIIKHSNISLHPNNWNVNITFFKNIVAVDSGNSIYIDSVRSCLWNASTFDVSAFCWTGWQFWPAETDCLNELRSGPSHMESNETYYFLQPGDCFDLTGNLTVLDNWGHDITDETTLVVDVLLGTARVIRGDSCRCKYLSDSPCANEDVYGMCSRPCDEYHILLLPDFSSSNYRDDSSKVLIHPPHLPGINVNFSFLLCEDDGLVIDKKRGCVCDPIEYSPVCTLNSSACTTCFFGLGPTCAAFSNGWGMCGSCNDTGYGVAINYPYFICAKCHWYGIAIFLLVELVPALIMMIILAVLHISITNGNLNGFVLYSQLVSTHFPSAGLWYSHWAPSILFYSPVPFMTIFLTVYSVWNLDFLSLYPVHFCIPFIDDAVRVSLFQYIIAVYPLLFIVLTYVWIRWYNNGYRFVVWITRSVHQLLARFWQRFKIQPSLIDTYAGLLLLSFMCFLATSFKLSYFIIIDLSASSSTYAKHAVLGVTAVLCLLVFVVPLMVLLLFYHLKIFQQCLTWCKLDRPGLHALVDAYQGCFKNIATDGKERRYFAGIYLLFRFCYFAFVALPITSYTRVKYYHSPNDKYNSMEYTLLAVCKACLCFVMAGLVLLLQPYKKTAHNVIDFLILVLMTVIGASSFTNYEVVVDFEYILVYLPFFVLVSYLVYRLLCCKRKPKIDAHHFSPNKVNQPPESTPLLFPPTTSLVALDDYKQDDLYPDRMVNPGEYIKMADSINEKTTVNTGGSTKC